jgi:hypothetical protein
VSEKLPRPKSPPALVPRYRHGDGARSRHRRNQAELYERQIEIRHVGSLEFVRLLERARKKARSGERAVTVNNKSRRFKRDQKDT